jgi:hypothetical protein
MSRCSICYTVIKQEEQRTECSECKTEYHQVCWTEIGGCGTYGCRSAAVAEKPPVPVLVGAGWGDTKPCPSCAKDISASLLVCSCGAKFPWADPMTKPEYTDWLARESRISGARSTLIFLFVLSLIGITAPLAGAIAGIFAYRRRNELVGTGGTYLAVGYGSAALGAIYTVLLVLVATGY